MLLSRLNNASQGQRGGTVAGVATMGVLSALLVGPCMTANDARQRELTRAQQVVGPPTVMLFDAAGRERREARLVGEFTVDQFLQRQVAGVKEPA